MKITLLKNYVCGVHFSLTLSILYQYVVKEVYTYVFLKVKL